MSQGGLAPIEGLSEKQQKEILVGLIVPGFAWTNTPSVAFWYQVRSLAYDRMGLVIHTLLPRDLADGAGGKEIAEVVEGSIRDIHLEDIVVNEGVWRGLLGVLSGQGQMSLVEESIWLMNQWWVERMGKE